MRCLSSCPSRFTRQPAKEAEVDAALWRNYAGLKDDLAGYEKAIRAAEIKLREQAGEASVLTVEGQPVARRVIVDAQVKAHVRHQDYLKRINQGDDDA